MDIAAIPAPIWAFIGVFVAAAIAAIATIVGHLLGDRRAKMKQSDDRLVILVKHLEGQVTRLDERVDALERTRDAYRSWSHVLWEWGSIAQTPENPRPPWPTELAR